MKYLIIIALLSCLSAFAFAETAANPMQEYLQDPSSRSFQQAVNALSESAEMGSEINKTKLNLAYIANYEADRLISELVSIADSLAAGERFTLANILLSREDYATSIVIYESLNKEFPKWSCAWRHKGEALYKSRDYASAAVSLEQAIATNEEHYDAYVWMAMTLNKLERYPEALKNLEQSMLLSDSEEDGGDEEFSEQSLKELYLELQQKIK
ncbi:MAG: hypothetical protein PHO32_10290 [Candidatus Cloacimonetes bacterium]|nr:hypothetical protein [Candidatus Cloacimonadota bacterium]